ncbi:hypothetical protein SBOR_5923 [Sclerotinia borealis F-4128]|uniref:Uncharacterized protein n=1 Tax=Sclerotinia borealis (strain F-4128) TaxID=1432307 RepID=W9CCY0_SCLBF|nr:hypothetical protein SBOR_5923 [Sclerotinia borealis F-4128]
MIDEFPGFQMAEKGMIFELTASGSGQENDLRIDSERVRASDCATDKKDRHQVVSFETPSMYSKSKTPSMSIDCIDDENWFT